MGAWGVGGACTVSAAGACRTVSTLSSGRGLVRLRRGRSISSAPYIPLISSGYIPRQPWHFATFSIIMAGRLFQLPQPVV